MSASAGPWDAIVVGGGHNGLVCAAYLARAGMRTLLLESRAAVGGAAATSQIMPAVRVPTLAHTVGRLAPVVARELGLARHGLRLVQPAALVTSVGADGGPLTLWSDRQRTVAELAATSPADAAAWLAVDDEIRELASVLWPLLLSAPPDVTAPDARDLLAGLRIGWRYRRLGASRARELTRAFPQPVADWLEDRLETEALRAMLATRGLRYTSLGPHAAGSMAHLLTDAAGNGGGAAGETVFARGGPGMLTAAIAAAAREAGVTIRTAARVVSVRDRDSVVRGVAVSDGEEIDAPIVASGLDPRTTLLDLVDPGSLGPELGWDAGNLRARGVTAKVNLALTDLPAFEGLGGDDAGRRLRGRIVMAPTIGYLDRAADAAKYGRMSDEPWLEATIPSLVDPLLLDGAASAGIRHVMSVIVQSAPVHLRGTDWDAQRDVLGDRVLAVLERVAPGIGSLVAARQVLTPLDLERDYGMSGGHPLHLEPGLDQWFAWRPLFGFARHRMPLAGLYLCGSGAHPGGGITGLPGRNAAGVIISDVRSGRHRPGPPRRS